MSLQQRAEEIQRQVVGFIVPIFSEQTPDGLHTHLLTNEDFEAVMEGYACGECLAKFSHYTVRCPICGLTRDVTADVRATPQMWIENLKERNEANPRKFVPSTFDQAMKEKLG